MPKNHRRIWFGVSLVFCLVSVSCLLPLAVRAGFGISSPYVRNERLIRGSHYEKKVTLVRGDPIEDLKAEITINVPGADDWISIDKGMEFILPKGEKQIPIIVKVEVPKKADYGNYKGNIRVRTIPLERPAGQIAIALGAQIDVDLTVAKGGIFDFKVKGVGVVDLEEGHKFLFFYLSGKIKFSMEIENTGNMKGAPTKVYFDIYDFQEKELLESTETKRIEKVEPFETKKVVAKLPTKLLAGSYIALFEIYKDDEVVNKGKIHLSILPYGTLGKESSKILGLQIWIWLFIVIVVLGGIGYGVWKGYKVWAKKREKPKIKEVIKQIQAKFKREEIKEKNRPSKRGTSRTRKKRKITKQTRKV